MLRKGTSIALNDTLHHPSNGYRVLTTSGRPYSLWNLISAWLTQDALRARLSIHGKQEWSFEALMPTSPFHLRRTFASATARNLALMASRPKIPHDRTPPPFPCRLPKGPARMGLRLNKTNWQLGVMQGDPFGSNAPTAVDPILPLPGALRADPFPLRHAGADWLLFEEQLKGDRGRLRAARKSGTGWDLLPGQILDLPHHLSWPSTVEIGGRLHLLPETGEANEVALWESIEFPMRWKKTRVLLEGRHWHDPSLVKIGELWWLFVSAGGDYPLDHSSELHAFWCRDPLNEPLVPHALNPLSVSVAGSRPAGNPVVHDRTVVRPTQDCRAGYGTGVLLSLVDRLSSDDWSESVIKRINPPAGFQGIHTLNHLPGTGWIVDVV